jgi:hypothetical protein
MAKREPDGTITLAQANAEQREIDKTIRAEKEQAGKLAHAAIDAAFQSPLHAGRRQQKNMRAGD